MALEDNIRKALKEFGVQLALDLNKSFIQALKAGGSKNVQNPALHFNPEEKVENGSATIYVYASDKYWRFVESGRKRGAKAPPQNVFGKKWQNLNGINPSKVLYEIQVEYNKRKGFKRNVKRLPFDKAVPQFAFLVARSIKRRGIKPKPFKDRIIEDGRLDELQNKLSEIIGKDITLNFTI